MSFSDIFKSQKDKEQEIQYIGLGRSQSYETPEYKMKRLKYVDPVSLNFKCMFDFTSTYGLLADENYKNSALAYLKRIGEEDRYILLKKWLELFKTLFRDYEFLILDISGLDRIQNINPWEFFNNQEDNIDMNIRETVDLYVQMLLTTYRQIWYDDIRKVEILPENLRYFDMSIFVYSAGYYDMFMYDDMNFYEFNSENIDRFIFPTIQKLDTKLQVDFKKFEKFNHTIYKLTNCQIDNANSGKGFTQSLSNEPNSDYVKNNISINYRYGSYSGVFNNTIGNFNIGALLALSSVYSKDYKEFDISKNEKETFKGQLSKLKGKLINQKNEWKDSFKNGEILRRTYSNLKNSAETKLLQQIGKLASNSSPLGNLMSKMTPKFAEQMISQAFNKGFTIFEDYAINNPLTKLNNLLMNNFSVYSRGSGGELFGNNFKPEIDNSIKYDDSNNIYLNRDTQKIKNLDFKKDNIYAEFRDNNFNNRFINDRYINQNIYDRDGF